MTSKLLSALSAAVLGVAALGQSAPAQAGNVSNAQLSCYIDTYAYAYSHADAYSHAKSLERPHRTLHRGLQVAERCVLHPRGRQSDH